VRRKLELLLLLVVIGLAARSTQPPEQPLVRSFRLADGPGCYGRWSFQFTVRADEEGAHWRATGRRDEMRVLQDGHWTLAEWNELVHELEKHGLRRLQNVPHYAATREVEVDQRKARFVPFEQNFDFDEAVEKGPIEQLDQQLYQAVRKKIEKDWTTRTFHLKVAPASKVIGFLQGQFRGDAVFTQTAENSLTVRAGPKTLQELAIDIPHLDRLPDPRLLPPPR